MTSLVFDIDPKERESALFVSWVGECLQKALLERKALGKLTQQEIADRLNINRSRVNRCFSGYANLTLESLSELVWAIDGEISFTIKIKNFRESLGNHIVECASNEDQIKRPSVATTSSTANSFFNWEFETASAKKQLVEVL